MALRMSRALDFSPLAMETRTGCSGISAGSEKRSGTLKVFLAGGIAEEMIFGEEKATISRSFDREEATSMIMEYIRKYGFDKNFQAYYAHSGPYSMDLSVTDWAIERMIRDLMKETQEILEKNKEFLVFLSKLPFLTEAGMRVGIRLGFR